MMTKTTDIKFRFNPGDIVSRNRDTPSCRGKITAIVIEQNPPSGGYYTLILGDDAGYLESGDTYYLSDVQSAGYEAS